MCAFARFRCHKIDDRREGADTIKSRRSPVTHGSVRRRDRFYSGHGGDAIFHGTHECRGGRQRHKRRKERRERDNRAEGGPTS